MVNLQKTMDKYRFILYNLERNNKMKKMISSLMLIAVILSSTFAFATSLENNIHSDEHKVGESVQVNEPYEKFGWSKEEYEKRLKNEDSNDMATKLRSSFPRKKVIINDVVTLETAYPDDYAGAYIDENNVLHIKTVGTKSQQLYKAVINTPVAEFEEKLKSFNDAMFVDGIEKSGLQAQSFASSSEKGTKEKGKLENGIQLEDFDAKEVDKIVFETAEYSYNYLLYIQSVLDEVMIKYNITSQGVDESINRLEITLKDIKGKDDIVSYLTKSIKDFDEKSLFFIESDSEMKNMYGTEPTVYNAVPGSCAYSTNQGGDAFLPSTISFTAYRASTGQYGMVSCGHGNTAGRVMLNSIYSELGTVALWSQGQQSGSITDIDASFTPFNRGYGTSSCLYGSTYLNDKHYDITSVYMSTDAITQGGNAVDKYGAKTGHTSGTIANVNVTSNNKDNNTGIVVTVTNQIRVKMYSEGGDSGGPLVRIAVKQSEQARPSVILEGTLNAGNGTYTCFTKAYRILGQWGLTLMTGSSYNYK